MEEVSVNAEAVPLFSGWLWEMFQTYVRKIRRTASTGAPAIEIIQADYLRIFPEASIKVLVEEKVGMIVVFHEMEERSTAGISEMMREEQLMAYLARVYGHGKYKINLYHGLTFVATKNFKVLDESLPEHWRSRIPERN